MAGNGLHPRRACGNDYAPAAPQTSMVGEVPGFRITQIEDSPIRHLR
jgi:hypothetical protein